MGVETGVALWSRGKLPIEHPRNWGSRFGVNILCAYYLSRNLLLKHGNTMSGLPELSWTGYFTFLSVYRRITGIVWESPYLGLSQVLRVGVVWDCNMYTKWDLGLTAPRCTDVDLHSVVEGARCSSAVRAFARGAMGCRISPSWGGPIELFLVPANAPRLV